MRVTSVWLLHHKASMGLSSQMNLDGSDFMIGVGVVPATSMKEAIDRFEQYLAENDMELVELWKCEQYSPSGRFGSEEEDLEIREVAPQALDSGTVYYACGISSEALDCMDGDDNSQS